jgi:hypothetical protein
MNEERYIPEEGFVRIGRSIIHVNNIAYVQQDESIDYNVTVYFVGGPELYFHGEEAIEVWRMFDGSRHDE